MNLGGRGLYLWVPELLPVFAFEQRTGLRSGNERPGGFGRLLDDVPALLEDVAVVGVVGFVAEDPVRFGQRPSGHPVERCVDDD